MNVIMFNGPPGIGKDTIVDIIKGSTYTCTVSEMIKYECDRYYGIQRGSFSYLMSERDIKDKPFYVDKKISDKVLSPRDMLIHYADNIAKPEHGQSVFIDKVVQEAIGQHCRDVIFTDLGYDYEVDAFAKYFDKVIIVQLRHPDFNFNNDSREYISSTLDNVVTTSVDVERGNIEATVRSVENALREELRT